MMQLRLLPLVEVVIPIAVSNSGNSCCVAVESTCLEKFKDTIGIMCLLILEMVYDDSKGVFDLVKAFINLFKAFTGFLPKRFNS